MTYIGASEIILGFKHPNVVLTDSIASRIETTLLALLSPPASLPQHPFFGMHYYILTAELDEWRTLLWKNVADEVSIRVHTGEAGGEEGNGEKCKEPALFPFPIHHRLRPMSTTGKGSRVEPEAEIAGSDQGGYTLLSLMRLACTIF